MRVASLQFDAERAAFLERFDFNSVEPLGELGGGMFSRPVLIEGDGRRYLMRAHRFRSTVESFRFQAETIAWTADRGIACSRVVPLRDGSWCQRRQGTPGVLALHEYVEGSTEDWLQWHERKDAAEAFLPDLGRQVARLHNVLRQAGPAGELALAVELPPIQFDRLEDIHRLWNAELDRLHGSTAKSQPARVLLQLRSRIEEHWRALFASAPHIAKLPRQIVHGDISPVNLVLRQDEEWAFIDWDCVHIGWRIYDALGDVLNRPPVEYPELNQFRPDHVAAYLSGYERELDEALTATERDLVPAFCLARQLEDLRQRVQALTGLNEELEEQYAVMITRRVEMMDQISLN